jgi:two-component system, sensor histidine kinase
MPVPHLDDRIRREQIRSIYGTTGPGLMVTVLSAGLVSGILGGVGAVPWPTLIVFMVAMVVQAGVRLVLFYVHKRAADPDASWQLWARYFMIGALIGGLTLGAGSLWLLPVGHLDMQLLVLLFICAVASGAVTAFGVFLPALFACLVPLLLLPLGWMLWQGDWVHYALAAIMASWFAVVTEQARRFSASFRESVRLRLENEDLIGDLRRQKAIAEEASAAKSRFLAAASHDLRQPVHALSLLVATVRPRITDQEALGLIEQIDGSVQAMAGLFNGLLDISRLDAGVVAADPHPFPIQPLLERVCRDHERDARAKGLALEIVPTSIVVKSDPMLLERVVRNIVANAVAYTDSGRVVVGCRRGASASVQVWDTGRGIPPHEQEHVFKEFYQVANPERDRSRGVGLGLAIVKRLTTLLDHPLTFRSQPGQGTVFMVEVPMSGSDLREGAPARMAPAVTTQASGLVLVVEDEAVIRAATKTLLEAWGCRTLAAGSCQEMLELIAECAERPRLIICDYRLRDHENGIHVIERLRSEYNDETIPGLLITGDTAPDRLREASESGLMLLHKPVSNGRLRAAIMHLIGEEHVGQRADH